MQYVPIVADFISIFSALFGGGLFVYRIVAARIRQITDRIDAHEKALKAYGLL